MTTVSYDTKYLAADTAYTSGNITYTDIPFPKIHHINNTIFGMAGSLEIMINFTNEVKKSPNFDIQTFLQSQEGDFAAILYKNNFAIKIDKESNLIEIQDITNIPTTIGSGSYYSQEILHRCPDALVIVLEAIEKDPYTKGKIHYYGLKCDITNLPEEDVLKNVESLDKRSYTAHKEFFHIGNPISLSLPKGFEIVNKMINDKERNHFYN